MYYVPSVYNNGTECRLLLLSGTIPITFQKAMYNIPVDIYLPIQFPNLPPIVYVRPTPDMMVSSKHECVESDGLVKSPYLSRWAFASSSLIDMVKDLQRVFGEKPPLFSRGPANVTVKTKPPVSTGYATVADPSTGIYSIDSGSNRSYSQGEKGFTCLCIQTLRRMLCEHMCVWLITL